MYKQENIAKSLSKHGNVWAKVVIVWYVSQNIIGIYKWLKVSATDCHCKKNQQIANKEKQCMIRMLHNHDFNHIPSKVMQKTSFNLQNF